MSHTPTTTEIRLCAVHGRDHLTEEEFHRGIEAVRREAKAEVLREAAGIVSSQAAEEWRLDRGEGMPGGVSKIGAQTVAMSLDSVASIIGNRADQIEEGWGYE